MPVRTCLWCFASMLPVSHTRRGEKESNGVSWQSLTIRHRQLALPFLQNQQLCLKTQNGFNPINHTAYPTPLMLTQGTSAVHALLDARKVECEAPAAPRLYG